MAPSTNVLSIEIEDLDQLCEPSIEAGVQRLTREDISVDYNLRHLSVRYEDAPEGRQHAIDIYLKGDNSLNVMDSTAILQAASQMMVECKTLGLVTFSPGPRGRGGDYFLQFGIFPGSSVRKFSCANQDSRDLDMEVAWGQ